MGRIRRVCGFLSQSMTWV
uniref:Uncharacterized protein n=1 Tax=Anguilla anguilla TaxID=7936 RepID=A0A0E9P9K6_ANGAN